MADDKIVIGIEGDPRDLKEAIVESKGDVKTFGTAAEGAMQLLRREVEKAGGSFDDLSDRLDDTEDELSDAAKASGHYRDANNRLRNSLGQYVRETATANARSKDHRRSLDRLGKQAKETGGFLRSMFAGAIGGLATGGMLAGINIVGDAMRGLINIGKDSIAGYQVQAAAESKLEAAIRSTGGAAGLTAQQLKDHASALQELTNFGDEATLGFQTLLLTFKNVRGDEFLRATELGQDLSEMLGQDLKSSALSLGKALNDPIKGITALSRSGIQFTEQQRAQVRALMETGDMMGAQKIILDELEGQIGGTAAAAATASGSYTQLWNRLGDVGERFGGVLVQGLDAAMPLFDAGINILDHFMGGLEGVGMALTMTGGSFDTFRGYLADWTDATVWAVTYAQVRFEDLDSTVAVTKDKIALSLVSTAEDARHTLTKEIPAYLDYLGENWFEIWTTMSELHQTVLDNIWENSVKFGASIWDVLTGGDFEFDWTPLTEGFESALKPLPEIAKRTRTELEKQLELGIQLEEKEFASKFMTRLDKNKEYLNEIIQGAGSKVYFDRTNTAEKVDTSALLKDNKPKPEPKPKPRPKQAKVKTPKASKPKVVKQEKPDEVKSARESLDTLSDRISNAAASKEERVAVAQAARDVKAQETFEKILNALLNPPPLKDIAFNAGEAIGEFAADPLAGLKEAMNFFMPGEKETVLKESKEVEKESNSVFEKITERFFNTHSDTSSHVSEVLNDITIEQTVPTREKPTQNVSQSPAVVDTTGPLLSQILTQLRTQNSLSRELIEKIPLTGYLG